MLEKLNDFFTNSIKILLENQYENKNISQVVINSDFFKDEFLPNFNCENKSQHVYEQLNILSEVNGPVLYWFEFDNTKVEKDVLREKFLEYKNRLGKFYDLPDYRYTSSFKNDFSEVSNVLYVGKVERGFYQRIKTHLGFAASPKTAGMQLHHWFSKNINEFGDLTLNYIVFEPAMIDLIAIMEKIVAKEVKPLIGRY